MRRLTNFSQKGPEVLYVLSSAYPRLKSDTNTQLSISSSTGASFRAAPVGSRATVPMTHNGTAKSPAGVHVQACILTLTKSTTETDCVLLHLQMQTFTVADEDHLSDYNSEDPQKTHLPDPEAGDAEISAEFKRPPYSGAY